MSRLFLWAQEVPVKLLMKEASQSAPGLSWPAAVSGDFLALCSCVCEKGDSPIRNGQVWRTWQVASLKLSRDGCGSTVRKGPWGLALHRACIPSSPTQRQTSLSIRTSGFWEHPNTPIKEGFLDNTEGCLPGDKSPAQNPQVLGIFLESST